MVNWRKYKDSDADKRVLLNHLASVDKSAFGGDVSGITPETLVALDKSGFRLHRLRLTREHLALLWMLEWDSSLSDHDKSAITWEALSFCLAGGSITEGRLIEELNLREQKYLAASLQQYVALTFISIHKGHSVPRKKVAETTITISPDPPPLFLREFNSVLKKASLPHLSKIPENYQSVRIAVRAHTHTAAFSKAEKSLDLIRAIWNFSLNHEVSARLSFDTRHLPVNQIKTIPFYSLHTASGKLATETWWYDPNQTYASLPPYNDMRFVNLLQKEKQIHQMLTRLPYRTELESALRRYGRALDLPDWIDSFFHLWSLLEFLTGIRPGEPQKKVVERASLWFRPDDFNRTNGLILDALRDFRNRYVHTSEFTTETEAIMYAVKYYVEQMILFHLRNNFGFETIQESTLLLDMPKQLSVLEESLRAMLREQQLLSRKIELAEKLVKSWESVADSP